MLSVQSTFFGVPAGVISCDPTKKTKKRAKISSEKSKKALQNRKFSDIISGHFARERTFPHVAARLGGGVEVSGGKNKLLEEMKCQ